MRIHGDDAKKYNAIRLDSFANANQSELVLADDQTGEVSYTDKAGELKSVTLGLHAIRIVRK
jgi:hypothetical protein